MSRLSGRRVGRSALAIARGDCSLTMKDLPTNRATSVVSMGLSGSRLGPKFVAVLREFTSKASEVLRRVAEFFTHVGAGVAVHVSAAEANGDTLDRSEIGPN